MTGIIFTGHGSFASGIHSAVSLLAGESDRILSVDFPGDSVEVLKEKLQGAVSALLEKECRQIIILCDILGGSPFNVSATLSQEYSNVFVVYGVTVAIAVELCLRADDPDFSATEIDDLLEESQGMTGLLRVPQEWGEGTEAMDGEFVEGDEGI